MYELTPIHVTPSQLINLWKGQTIQIDKNALQKPNSHVLMHPLMSKKVHSALKKGTGCRVQMTRDEIMKTGPKGLSGSGRMTGQGWFSDAFDYLRKKIPEVGRWISNAYTDYVQPAINSELYQNKIRPKVENFIDSKLEQLPYADTTRDIANAMYDYTGLGMKKKRVSSKRKPKLMLNK